MSALDEMIKHHAEMHPSGQSKDYDNAVRAELAQLRADLQATQSLAKAREACGHAFVDACQRIAALEAAVNEAHLPEMIDSLKEIMDFVFMNEPCGYYCDEAVGHVDHRYTNWLRSIIGDLERIAACTVAERVKGE